MRNNLTDAAKLSEELTLAKAEIARLRAAANHPGRTAPAAASGTWHSATRKLPPKDRKRIANAVEAARNIFRWARRRRRLENTSWERGDPGTELRTIVRGIREERERREVERTSAEKKAS